MLNSVSVEEFTASSSASEDSVAHFVFVRTYPRQHSSCRETERAQLLLCILGSGISQQYPDRNANKPEFLGDRVTQKLFKALSDQLLVVYEQKERWRSRLNLHQVPHLQHFTSIRRHFLDFCEGVNPLIQESCRDASVPFLIDSEDFVHHLLRAQAFLG